MPIDPNYQMPKSEKKQYDALEADVYECSIKDVEKKISYFKAEDGSDREVFNITFEVADGPHKGRLLWKEARPFCFYGDKGPSILLSIVNAVEKRDLTPDEAESIGADRINALIGRHLRLTVSKEPGKDGTPRNKVKGFLPSKLSEGENIPF